VWIYEQSTGALAREGQIFGRGYSGAGEHRNDPRAEALRNEGPIPRGEYGIGPVYDSEMHGPVCMRLIPRAGTDTHGRDGFLIHGDSVRAPGSASHGCIVLPRSLRVGISTSGDQLLRVV
jgi:hypothetical protein